MGRVEGFVVMHALNLRFLSTRCCGCADLLQFVRPQDVLPRRLKLLIWPSCHRAPYRSRPGPLVVSLGLLDQVWVTLEHRLVF